MSVSAILANTSRLLATATIEVEVAEDVAEADVVGVTKAPTLAYF